VAGSVALGMSSAAPPGTTTPPYSREQAIDLYFIEHRGKLLDIAAFLDRVDRAAPAGGVGEDFRVAAFRRALGVLSDGKPERARRVLEALSDPTGEPIAAAGTKGATGAYPGATSHAGPGAGCP
jgi:hypothetical protein